jgi:hypothetical protein
MGLVRRPAPIAVSPRIFVLDKTPQIFKGNLAVLPVSFPLFVL